MTEGDPKIIKSKLCRNFTADGVTVSVEIYRLENSEVWSLEVVDEDWNSTVWEETFATDKGVKEYGLKKLLQTSDPDQAGTIH